MFEFGMSLWIVLALIAVVVPVALEVREWKARKKDRQYRLVVERKECLIYNLKKEQAIRRVALLHHYADELAAPKRPNSPYHFLLEHRIKCEAERFNRRIMHLQEG